MDEVIELHRRRRVQIVATHLMLGSVAFALVGGALRIAGLPDPATLAAVGVGAVTLASMVRAWRERVRFAWDELRVQRAATTTKSLRYSEIERVDLTWHNPNNTATVDATVTARFVPVGGGAALDMDATWGDLAPALARVNAVLGARVRAALARGEVVTFGDAPTLPWKALGLVTALVVAMVLALTTPGVHLRLTVQGVVLTLTLGAMAVRAIRTWWGARRARGVALSAEGIRELTRHRDDDGPQGYRVQRGPATGWIPWSEVRSVWRDGFGVRVVTGMRAEPIVLSPRTERLTTLEWVLDAHLARAREDATGVRVAVEADEVAEMAEARVAVSEAQRGVR